MNLTHLGSFQFEAIMNSWTFLHMSSDGPMSAFLLLYTGVELQRQKVWRCSALIEISKQFSKVAIPVSIPTSRV